MGGARKRAVGSRPAFGDQSELRFGSGPKMLTQDEIDKCREAFSRFDKDGSGTIDASELKQTLIAIGQNPSDEEVFTMISQVDDDGSGCIELSEFLKVCEKQKQIQDEADDETDLIDAFVARGGNADKSGRVEAEKL